MLGKIVSKPLAWFAEAMVFLAKLFFWLWLVLSPTLFALLVGGVLYLSSDEYGLYLFYGAIAIGVLVGIWWAESVRQKQYGQYEQEDVGSPATSKDNHSA